MRPTDLTTPCRGCGNTNQDARDHVVGERKCCPDCDHRPVAPEGTCLVCACRVPLVNFRPNEFGPGAHGGYLGRHGRPGINSRFKCRGSFASWVERCTRMGLAR